MLRLNLQAKNRAATATSAFLLMTICANNCKNTLLISAVILWYIYIYMVYPLNEPSSQYARGTLV